MKTQTLKMILFVGFSFAISNHSTFAQSAENIVINRFVAKQARVNKAEEYEKARKIISADLDGDGKKNAVVLYTLEGFGGSNLYVQYLAIFVQSRGALHYAAHRIIGGKNRRDISLKSVENGKINLDKTDYLPNDASCCPSKKGRTQVILSKNKLVEIKR